MMTKSDFRMPFCAAWLLLVAILCVAVLPTLAVAKMDIEIAREGDPGDGMDSAGSGGGDSEVPSGDNLQSNEADLYFTDNWAWGNFEFVPFWNEQGLQFRLVFRSINQGFRRNI